MPLQDDFRESPFVPELPSPPAAQSGPDVTLDLGTTGWGGDPGWQRCYTAAAV